jgi:AcrR family transcriptional regulator
MRTDTAGSRPAPKTRGAARSSATCDALVEAAARAFNGDGYHGTDTNKIARAAGFAPQTFYRHFRDKMDVFLAVYERWQVDEREAIARAAKERAAEAGIVKALLDHHLRYRVFRRSLRWLAVEDPEARKARAFSRERQLTDLARLAANQGRSRAALLAALLTVERLCDAAADGELADSGLDDEAVFAVVLDAVRGCRRA